MTFRDLQKLFQANKGKDIMLNKKDDKYSIRVYSNEYNAVGNFNIKYCANVQIYFKDDQVAVMPCKKGVCIYNKTKVFKLDDDIMNMKNLIATDFLTALVKYFDKHY